LSCFLGHFELNGPEFTDPVRSRIPDSVLIQLPPALPGRTGGGEGSVHCDLWQGEPGSLLHKLPGIYLYSSEVVTVPYE
jgi:hypothetical protein